MPKRFAENLNVVAISGDDEEQNESDDQEEMTEAFNSILQKVNSALDFCRRSQGVKADNDKKGLSIVSPIKPGTTPTSVTTAFGQFQKINSIENEGEGGAGPGGEVYEEAWRAKRFSNSCKV